MVGYDGGLTPAEYEGETPGKAEAMPRMKDTTMAVSCMIARSKEVANIR